MNGALYSAYKKGNSFLNHPGYFGQKFLFYPLFYRQYKKLRFEVMIYFQVLVAPDKDFVLIVLQEAETEES